MARFPQRWSTGPAIGKFLQALRDEKKILANVCRRCGRSQVPPREVCAVCRTPVTEFEEVGPEGILRNFDVVYYASPDPVTGHSREVPYATCYVELDGCQGGATLLARASRNRRLQAPPGDARAGCFRRGRQTHGSRPPISSISRSLRRKGPVPRPAHRRGRTPRETLERAGGGCLYRQWHLCPAL